MADALEITFQFVNGLQDLPDLVGLDSQTTTCSLQPVTCYQYNSCLRNYALG